MSENAHEHQQSVHRRAPSGAAASVRLCPLPRRLRASRSKPARSSSKAPTSSPATGAATKPPAPPSSMAGSAPAIWPVRSPDGYYTLCGRKSDLIISGGFNIYPREIEEFLQEQEEVAEAAVMGLPDPVRGEVPVAYIVSAARRSRGPDRPLPRQAGLLQSPPRLPPRREPPPQRHGQNPKTPPPRNLTVEQPFRRGALWAAPIPGGMSSPLSHLLPFSQCLLCAGLRVSASPR